MQYMSSSMNYEVSHIKKKCVQCFGHTVLAGKRTLTAIWTCGEWRTKGVLIMARSTKVEAYPPKRHRYTPLPVSEAASCVCWVQKSYFSFHMLLSNLCVECHVLTSILLINGCYRLALFPGRKRNSLSTSSSSHCHSCNIMAKTVSHSQDSVFLSTSPL